MTKDITVNAQKVSALEEKNRIYLHILALLVTMQTFIEVINVMINQFGLGNSSVATAAIYLIVLAVALWKVRFVAITDILILAGVYSLFALNYLLFPETRAFAITDGMMVLYVFFIPLCAIVIRKIRSFEAFFEVLYPYAAAAVAVGGGILLFFNYEEYLVYMEFSYAMLPSVCALYYALRTRQKKLSAGMFFIAGFVEMFTFGARAPLLFVLIFIVAYELLRTDNPPSLKIVFVAVGIIAALLFSYYEDSIIDWLNTIPIFSGSRVLDLLSSGELLESESRDMIKEFCYYRIQTMGMEISGFWGDRKYCAGQAYPHNIFLEILMTYGWIFGILAILLLGVLCLRALLKKGTSRDVALFLLVTLWGRYLISGSYIQEGKFWIGLFALIAVAFQCRSRKPADNQRNVPAKACECVNKGENLSA